MDIFNVVKLNDFEGVKQWLTPYCNINETDSRGITLINCASGKGHIEIVKLLLAQPGIDFNKADNGGWTPINNCIMELSYRDS
jgi:ankyrin repeat protein